MPTTERLDDKRAGALTSRLASHAGSKPIVNQLRGVVRTVLASTHATTMSRLWTRVFALLFTPGERSAARIRRNGVPEPRPPPDSNRDPLHYK